MEEKPKHSHNGHRIRLREKVRKGGILNFQPHEILEYMLSFVIARKDTNELAHKLIDEFGSFNNVLNASYDNLIKINGISDVSASFISSFTQVMEYYNLHSLDKNFKLSNNFQTQSFLAPIFTNKKEEIFLVVLTDVNRQFICQEQIAKGSEKECSIRVKEVQTLATKHNAKHVIIAHNHPTNVFSPSGDDYKLTKMVYINLAAFDIQLDDHCIFMPTGDCYSFVQDGLMDIIKKEAKNFLETGNDIYKKR